MNIVETTACELTGKQKAACRSLSFRNDGDLCSFISRPDTKIVMALDDDGTLLGWGAKVMSDYYDNFQNVTHRKGATGYYVRKSRRRQGIGAKIFYTLNPPRSKKSIFPHDARSYAFFYSLGQLKKQDIQYTGLDPKEIRRKPRRQIMEEISV